LLYMHISYSVCHVPRLLFLCISLSLSLSLSLSFSLTHPFHSLFSLSVSYRPSLALFSLSLSHSLSSTLSSPFLSLIVPPSFSLSLTHSLPLSLLSFCLLQSLLLFLFVSLSLSLCHSLSEYTQQARRGSGSRGGVGGNVTFLILSINVTFIILTF